MPPLLANHLLLDVVPVSQTNPESFLRDSPKVSKFEPIAVVVKLGLCRGVVALRHDIDKLNDEEDETCEAASLRLSPG